jgi:hypothetical protein
VLKKTLRFLLPCVALLSFFALATSSTLAATTAPSRSVAGGVNTPCRTLEVQLHGTQPATTTCLDRQTTSPAGVVTPQIYEPIRCSSTDELDLYSDANWTGYHMCLIGSGTANLGDYYPYHAGTWDNKASSYYTGCSPVTFYTNVNRTGYSISEPAYHAGNFTPGTVGNDTLTSVYLSSNCSA